MRCPRLGGASQGQHFESVSVCLGLELATARHQKPRESPFHRQVYGQLAEAANTRGRRVLHKHLAAGFYIICFFPPSPSIFPFSSHYPFLLIPQNEGPAADIVDIAAVLCAIDIRERYSNLCDFIQRSADQRSYRKELGGRR